LCAGGDDTDGFMGDPRKRNRSNQHTRREPIVDELPESVEIEESDEDARVYEWRVEQLSGLGLPEIVASAVAPFVDWHELARLVERGCSPELALEIVR
jgi:hypothetical protein